jgi:hypothetical protein
MSRIVKVSNGDYRLQVQTGGNIILDTQATNGKVLVIGNLDVQGALTYVESTNTQVTDNIIQLNYGQTGNGISAGNNYTSGIEIERGNYNAAQFVFNEQLTHYDATSSSNVSGTWSARTANGTLNAIQLRTIVTDGVGNLSFDLLNSNITLRIANSSNYYLNVSDNNDIINLQYLKAYVASSYSGSGQGQAIVDRVMYPVASTTTIANANSSIEANATNIVFQIAQTTYATVSSNGITAGYVQIGGGSSGVPQWNTITNTSSNNLIITANNGYVELKAVTQLDHVGTSVTYNSTGTQIYSSSTVGPGKTGIYFANASGSQTPDELISRNRAVLLSILL